MSDKIRVNGNTLSWGSIKLKINGDRFTGFTSISYGEKRERVYQYGMGPAQAPRGISRGKYTPDPIKLGGPKSTFADLRAALAAQSADGRSYGNVVFQIFVEYVETDDSPVTVELIDCFLTANTSTEEESADSLKEEVEIMCMRVLKNGLSLYDGTEGAP